MHASKFSSLMLLLGTLLIVVNLANPVHSQVDDRVKLFDALEKGDPEELQQLRDKHWRMSQTFHEERQFSAARSDARICLEIDLKLHEEPHAVLGDSFEWYATLCDLSEGRDAENAWLRAIDNKERIYGVDNWRVTNAKVGLDRSRILQGLTKGQLMKLSNATTKERIAMVCFAKGELDNAIKMQTFVVQERSKLLGETSSDTAYSISGLGEIYEEKKDFAQAEIYFVQASNILKQTLKEDHPYYAKSLEALAKLYQKMGDNERAQPLLQQAMEIKANAELPPAGVQPDK